MPCIIQSVNLIVLCLLESYFDMSKANASISLGIYESYVEVNEKVIDFFKVAKRVESAISNEIPDITPVSTGLPHVKMIDCLQPFFIDTGQSHSYIKAILG